MSDTIPTLVGMHHVSTNYALREAERARAAGLGEAAFVIRAVVAERDEWARRALLAEAQLRQEARAR